VLSIKVIYLELLISHFIRPIESAELPNVAHTSKSLESPGIDDKMMSHCDKHEWHKLTHAGIRSPKMTVPTFLGKSASFIFRLPLQYCDAFGHLLGNG
jgi:hypothetical protein